MFNIVGQDKNSGARVGSLITEHGIVETPSYVVVGTNAQVRSLQDGDLAFTKTQIVIANTFHLWRRLGKNLQNFNGLYQETKWAVPTMTDSGGFQVFSLGFGREHGVGKIASMFPDENNGVPISPEKNLVRITEEGVYFLENGKEVFLDAETSIRIQEKLGADMILAFDECTSPFHDHAYTRTAMRRTHRWAVLCLEAKSNNKQQLFGIVQGGAFRDLREESAKFIGELPFDGFAIGGSLGKSRKEMFDVIRWSIPFLPAKKSRHLLGIGKVRDLFEAIELGVDTFDCVVPTREARHGALWTRNGRFDILKGIYERDNGKIDDACQCIVCGEWRVKRKDLRALFKEKNSDAARFATIHNLHFFNNLMEKIRESIVMGRFMEFKAEFLSRLHF